MSKSRDIRGGDKDSKRMLIGNSLFSEFRGDIGEGETYQFLAIPGMLNYRFLISKHPLSPLSAHFVFSCG